MAKTRWAKVNKCVICGGNLVFVPDKARGSGQGIKHCEQNHPRFYVSGFYDAAGYFHITFTMPGKMEK